MCAHPRIDPTSGEMVLFRYNLEEPYLMWASIAADGTVAHQPDPIDVDGAYMIHDFTITPRFVVLFVAPAQFDLQALMTGKGQPLAWNGDKPVRIAVIPRDGTSSDVRWIETEPFWAYHFANAYEDGGNIVVDFARFKYFALGKAPDQTGAITRARIDPTAGKVTLDTFDERITEFPRIDNRLQTQPHRYFNVSAKAAGTSVGEFDVLLRVDTSTGVVTEWDSGAKVFDEVVFAPAEGGADEQGYYVTFRTDVDSLRSDWVVLDASDIAAGPVATVELPFRVPAGLHGNWFPTSTL